MSTLFPRLIFTLLLCGSLISAPLQATEYSFQKVVYHINYGSQQRISETFTNIENHLAAVGEERSDIKVVIHGKAIEYLIDASDDEGRQAVVDNLKLQGVELLICGNTLNGYGIEHDALYDVQAEDVVQAGLPAIVDLQQRGYIYVRP